MGENWAAFPLVPTILLPFKHRRARLPEVALQMPEIALQMPEIALQMPENALQRHVQAFAGHFQALAFGPFGPPKTHAKRQVLQKFSRCAGQIFLQNWKKDCFSKIGKLYFFKIGKNTFFQNLKKNNFPKFEKIPFFQN